MEYNDQEYQRLIHELRSVITQMLAMDGNDRSLVEDEVANILDDQ